jgi:hypothetical protein
MADREIFSKLTSMSEQDFFEGNKNVKNVGASVAALLVLSRLPDETTRAAPPPSSSESDSSVSDPLL